VGIQNYLRVVAWYWYVVLSGLVIGLVCAGVVSNRTPTTYASEVTMILAPTPTADESIAYQGALLATERAKSYAPLLTTEELAGGVVRQLGLDLYPVELVGATSVTLDPDTVLIKARVVDGSAQRVQQIADAMGVEFTRLVADLERNADPSNAPALTVKVVQPATFSDTPFAPNVMLNLILGAILGLLAGLGGALALNALRMPVRSVRDVTEVTRSPLLGVVRTDPASTREPLAVADRPDSPQAEAFRRICAGLTFEAGSPGKIAAVVSSDYGDGRTSVAGNLAVALAQTRRRVVLVDCDLRHPKVGELFGIGPTDGDSPADREVGVADVLEGSAPLDVALRPCGNGFLDVLAAGRHPAHPGGLLASDRTQHLLTELARRYDVVLLDTPPILPVSDAVALARGADGVVLVVRFGRTGRRDLHAVMETLEAVSAPVIGTILNRVPAWCPAAVVRSDPAAPRLTPPRSVDDGLRGRFDGAGTSDVPSTMSPTAALRSRTLNSARPGGD
jgi:capsular exopolysaccharide synthesis family protein